jgi:single-stranded-DNA-specific exonuclease
MGSAQTAADLFFEKDHVKREKIAAELAAMNESRKELEEETWAIVEPMAYKSLTEYDEKLAVVYSEKINKGVTGLMAQRTVRQLNVPAIAISFGDEICSGSLRSARGYNVCALLEQCSDLFIDSGGHVFAGGFSLEKNNWDAFLERLKSIAYSIEFDEAADGQGIWIDAELPHDYLTPDILKLTDRFKPYGKDNEPLTFLAKGLLVEEINFIGKNESRHIKMLLATGKYKWPALYWDAAVRVVNREFGTGDLVDVVFSVARDWYKGIATVNMIVNDLRKST